MAAPSLCLAGVAMLGRFRRWFQTTARRVPGRCDHLQESRKSRVFTQASGSYPVPDRAYSAGDPA